MCVIPTRSGVLQICKVVFFTSCELVFCGKIDCRVSKFYNHKIDIKLFVALLV